MQWHHLDHMLIICTSLQTDNHTNTHTHVLPFNGPFSGTTRVCRYQKSKTNLDFTEARDVEWQWHRLGYMQVCTSLQTDNHASTSPFSFFTGRMPFLSPNQQRQSTEGTTTPIPHHLMFTGRMFFLTPNQQCQSTKDTMGGGGIANKMSMVRYVSVCV